MYLNLIEFFIITHTHSFLNVEKEDNINESITNY